MKSVIFNIKEDHNGFTGLLYEHAPDHFDAIDYNNKASLRLLAHDILEHDILKDDGSIEAEFMAIGAAMFGRGNHDQLNFVNDFVSMAIDAYTMHDFKIKPTNKGIKKFDAIEWILDEDEFFNSIMEELKYYGDVSKDDVRAFVKLGMQYCRIGARRASKFYKNNTFTMYNQFVTLVHSLYDTCRYMEEFDNLKISWDSNKFKLSIISPNFDYYD